MIWHSVRLFWHKSICRYVMHDPGIYLKRNKIFKTFLVRVFILSGTCTLSMLGNLVNIILKSNHALILMIVVLYWQNWHSCILTCLYLSPVSCSSPHHPPHNYIFLMFYVTASKALSVIFLNAILVHGRYFGF